MNEAKLKRFESELDYIEKAARKKSKMSLVNELVRDFRETIREVRRLKERCVYWAATYIEEAQATQDAMNRNLALVEARGDWLALADELAEAGARVKAAMDVLPQGDTHHPTFTVQDYRDLDAALAKHAALKQGGDTDAATEGHAATTGETDEHE